MFDLRILADESGYECDSKLNWVHINFISLIVTRCHDFYISYIYTSILVPFVFSPQENDSVIESLLEFLQKVVLVHEKTNKAIILACWFFF
jgi:hypothetical protein